MPHHDQWKPLTQTHRLSSESRIPLATVGAPTPLPASLPRQWLPSASRSDPGDRPSHEERTRFRHDRKAWVGAHGRAPLRDARKSGLFAGGAVRRVDTPYLLRHRRVRLAPTHRIARLLPAWRPTSSRQHAGNQPSREGREDISLVCHSEPERGGGDTCAWRRCRRESRSSLSALPLLGARMRSP